MQNLKCFLNHLKIQHDSIPFFLKIQNYGIKDKIYIHIHIKMKQ